MKPLMSSHNRERGVALIIVLFLVVIVSMMVVGLLLTSRGERQSAVSQAKSMDARIASESVLQIVQGQIRKATTEGMEGDLGTFTWASQPGALRVFDDTGRERHIFKLYSSDAMIVDGDTDLSVDVPDGWQNMPDLYTDLNEPVKRDNEWIYPIATPDAIGEVEGFSSDLDNTSGPQAGDNRLAMPVRWLYLYKDGTLSADPSQGDPIARIAFWTDDESSKINLNTASASDADSYWDIPRATFKDDRDLYAWRQPSENEFNRYPGHPATVNLRTVFPDLSIQDLIEASPRYAWGGSENATRDVNATRVALDNTKEDRLYATPDEYLYRPRRITQLNLDAPKLDNKRFFLTTASQSSDLNLFGQPRITIWPISGIDDDLHRTIYDRAIAFSSTLGIGAYAKPYYFLRSDPDSQTADWDLYPRNQEIFLYLRNLTSRRIPGFGGDFKSKYDYGAVEGERDQILTEILDYIRTVNLNETYKARSGTSGGENFISYTNDRISGDDGTNASFIKARGAGWVLPLKTPYGRGAGRVPVISEVGLWFIQTQDSEEKETGTVYTNPSPPEIQPAFIIETFSPMQGVMQWNPATFSYKVTNIVPPTVNGAPLIPDAEYKSTWAGPGSAGWARSQNMGGTDGFGWLMTGGLSTAEINHIRDVPLLRKKVDAIKLPSGATTFDIQGGVIEIAFMTSPTYNTRGQGTVFQTYRIAIPDTTGIPVPTAIRPPTKPSSGSNREAYDDGWIGRKNQSTDPPIFNPADVVRGLAIRHGDYRTEAYMENVPESFFQDALQSKYGFRNGNNKAYMGAENGSYVSGLYYTSAQSSNSSSMYSTPRPKIPVAINGLVEQNWDADFDNGMANQIDGPYLNKSDEGSLSANNSSRVPYFFERGRLADGLFSPFRQVPSAVVFGSLPTGVKHVEAGQDAFWRTLVFAPHPLSGSSHLGLSNPPDHLLLDLFTMPIVEPYAISEPLSTAGRVNMNHQLVPFQYITRTTALRAVLSSQKVIAIADNFSSTYKTASYPSSLIRFAVNPDETLKFFDKYLASKNQNLFRSASEICSIYLVPNLAGVTADSVSAWWNSYRITGNNSREKPYASLYPMLTTKSNTFTTHIRVQSIVRQPSGQIVVQGEYRGSVLFERYLDPHDPVFSDGRVNPDKVSLEPWFRFRTLASKRFDL